MTLPHDKPRDYSQVVQALNPILSGLPGKIVAIDGRPGVGKTTAGRYLAYYFNVSLVETDLFLKEDARALVYRNDEIARIIQRRLAKPRPVIVEGAVVLQLLKDLDLEADFVVYIANSDAPECYGNLEQELLAYEAAFAPRKAANLVCEFSGCD